MVSVLPTEMIASTTSDDSELYALMSSYLDNNSDVDAILAARSLNPELRCAFA
ncbi:MAG: hypothetical protein R2865_11715 [Deinococcales bacterium]